jgi:hypothetical protein
MNCAYDGVSILLVTRERQRVVIVTSGVRGEQWRGTWWEGREVVRVSSAVLSEEGKIRKVRTIWRVGEKGKERAKRETAEVDWKDRQKGLTDGEVEEIGGEAQSEAQHCSSEILRYFVWCIQMSTIMKRWEKDGSGT